MKSNNSFTNFLKRQDDILYSEENNKEELIYLDSIDNIGQSQEKHTKSWGKLRTTLRFSGISRSSGNNFNEYHSKTRDQRRDSFIERFSTLRSENFDGSIEERSRRSIKAIPDSCTNQFKRCSSVYGRQRQSSSKRPSPYHQCGSYSCGKSGDNVDEEISLTGQNKHKASFEDCCSLPEGENIDVDDEDFYERCMTENQKTTIRKKLLNDFCRRFAMSCSENFTYIKEEHDSAKIDECTIRTTKIFFLWDPQGSPLLVWLTILSFSILYNIWIMIARQAFSELNEAGKIVWFYADILTDIVYFFDIIVQLRTSHREIGLAVYRQSKLTLHYVKTKEFLLDLLALLPIDWIISMKKKEYPISRFNRFMKLHRFWQWKMLVENRTIFPNIWRVLNLLHILLLGCHWFAAFYYMLSEFDEFQNPWGYPDPINNPDFKDLKKKYLISFYWSALTLTTIGSSKELLIQRNIQHDINTTSKYEEVWYAFTIVAYFLGVFIFATIVGQVGNIITNRNATRLEFESILDKAKNYMRLHNVPTDMQKRVLRWYDYAWSRGRTHGGGDINQLELLPDKLKTEMALHVNLKVLKKVYIFQECRPEFLHDLVLKMKPYIFTPGDYICRTGEVARELFIIADGVLEVINDQGVVLTKMGSGDFFGEIGVLNLDEGINKRTANVKAVGYVELFVLHRQDVLEALKEHPDAEKLIIQLGTQRLNEIKNDRNKLRNIPTPANLIKELEENSSQNFKNKDEKQITIETCDEDYKYLMKITNEKRTLISERDKLLENNMKMKKHIEELERLLQEQNENNRYRPK